MIILAIIAHTAAITAGTVASFAVVDWADKLIRRAL